MEIMWLVGSIPMHFRHFIFGSDSDPIYCGTVPIEQDPPELLAFELQRCSIPRSNASSDRSSQGPTQPRCSGCFRPESLCYCCAIPKIDNQTDLLIVQHVRERDHPFNTARMVHRALAKSSLVFGTKKTIAQKSLAIASDAGLLFPSRDSIELETLHPDQRPSQLVVIDGTWSQAKSLHRALPQLQSLPCYKIAPAQPGQYQIRLEPTDQSLSTVEATVAALSALEPETQNLEQLLVAFELMIQKQLDHPEVGEQHYSGGPIDGSTLNVPNDLYIDPSRIIVAYGEANFREQSQPKNIQRTPVFWCAQNLGTGETFVSPLQTVEPLPDTFLNHLELSRSDFEPALSMSQFLSKWNQFTNDAAVLVTYNEGTLKLLKKAQQLAGQEVSTSKPRLQCVTLKSINFKSIAKHELSDSTLPRSGMALGDLDVSNKTAPSLIPGRAGARLANIVSMTRFLLECRQDADKLNAKKLV